jgi:hypothetical protein
VRDKVIYTATTKTADFVIAHKYSMTKKHTPFLQSIYDTCKSIGIVETQHEFSALCGRGGTWFSAAKAKDAPISTAAAYTLAVRLKQISQTELPRKVRPHAMAICGLLFALINERAARTR